MSDQTQLSMDLDAFIAAEALPATFAHLLRELYVPVADAIEERRRRLGRAAFVGVSGPQGSGKSTGSEALRRILEDRGLKTALLSLDDFYLTRVERLSLAREVHPLLITRGPPGTHDMALAGEVIHGLLAGHSMALPRFDKSADDRAAESSWPHFEGAADVLLFEGWCVGATPEPPSHVTRPINDLERDRDPHGSWRTYVNRALGDYQPLFASIDYLLQLKPPSFEVVAGWRREQEHKLRSRLGLRQDARVMSDEQIEFFVQHYERITRRLIEQLPTRADAVAELGPDRELMGLKLRP